MAFLDEELALIDDDPRTRVPQFSVAFYIPDLLDADDEFKNFLETFSAFLQPPLGRFIAGLVKIERRMYEKALGRAGRIAFGDNITLDSLIVAMETSKSLRGDMKTYVASLLSDVLTEIENQFMLTMDRNRRRAVTLFGFVEPDDFRGRLIQKSRTWKDATVPWSHGEFTHRLQWCAGMESLPELTNWGRNFMAVGSYEDMDEFGAGNRIFGLWDALVDRNQFYDAEKARLGVPQPAINVPYESSSLLDFRSPENLQAWLLKANHRAPGQPFRLLATFLYQRAEKRKLEQSDEDNPGKAFVPYYSQPNKKTWDFWSRILFDNLPFSEMTDPIQKARLARARYRLEVLGMGKKYDPILERIDSDNDQPDVIDPNLKLLYESVGLSETGGDRVQ